MTEKTRKKTQYDYVMDEISRRLKNFSEVAAIRGDVSDQVDFMKAHEVIQSLRRENADLRTRVGVGADNDRPSWLIDYLMKFKPSVDNAAGVDHQPGPVDHSDDLEWLVRREIYVTPQDMTEGGVGGSQLQRQSQDEGK